MYNFMKHITYQTHKKPKQRIVSFIDTPILLFASVKYKETTNYKERRYPFPE